MGLKLTNNAISTLASSITAGATSITLKTGDGAKFPTLSAGDYHPATILKPDGSLEIVRVTARSGDTLTVTRAQEGTTALSFNSGSLIEVRLTAAAIEDIASPELATVATTGSYTDLLNKPTIPTVPTNVSAFTNDSGYLTSFTETDPVFNASPAKNITSTNISNWNTAYGWGNHASAGYLTSATAATTYQALSARNAANGYAGLDSSGLIPTSLMPVCYAQSNRIDTDISIPDGYNGVWFGDTEVGPNVTVTGLGNSTLRGL